MPPVPPAIGKIFRQRCYEEKKVIGEGSFGKALLLQAGDASLLVCKMVDVSSASGKEQQEAAKEGRLLNQFKHPFIVQYREMFIESGFLCILMEYCEGGDLTSKIAQARDVRQRLHEDRIIGWMTQALLALKYIHGRHVLHRDLKSSNLFLSKSGHLKMGDFGIAKVLTSTCGVAKTQIGTPNYLSPEVCTEKPYAWPSDIWAMGCILYELCALRLPFEAPNILALVQKICSGQTPQIPEGYSDFVRQLFSEMLSRRPEGRPSADAILQRPRMQSVARRLLEEARSPAAAHQQRGAGGAFCCGDRVEYYSKTHGAWLPATIVNVDGEGQVVLDVKPNVWISRGQQAQQVRHKGIDAGKLGEESDAVANAAPKAQILANDAASEPRAAEERKRSNLEEISQLCEELGLDELSSPPEAAPGAIEPKAAAAVQDMLEDSGEMLVAELERLADLCHSPAPAPELDRITSGEQLMAELEQQLADAEAAAAATAAG